MISSIVAGTFDLLMLFMFIVALLSWFPNVPWYREPFKTMRTMLNIIVEPFRKIFPPFGMLDVSFIIAFFAIAILRKLCLMVLLRFGL